MSHSAASKLDKRPIHTESNTKKTTRRSSFTPTEDAAIAKAWISASENPVVGAGQKSASFFKCIAELYNENFKPANREFRSIESVKTRSRAIQKECMRFSGRHVRVVRLQPTGASTGDILNMAAALYNNLEMVNYRDDCGKPFRFMQAWEYPQEA